MKFFQHAIADEFIKMNNVRPVEINEYFPAKSYYTKLTNFNKFGTFSIEAMQDISAFHGIDLSKLLENALREQVTDEVNRIIGISAASSHNTNIIHEISNPRGIGTLYDNYIQNNSSSRQITRHW